MLLLAEISRVEFFSFSFILGGGGGPTTKKIIVVGPLSPILDKPSDVSYFILDKNVAEAAVSKAVETVFISSYPVNFVPRCCCKFISINSSVQSLTTTMMYICTNILERQCYTFQGSLILVMLIRLEYRLLTEV